MCLLFFYEESIHEVPRLYLDATYTHTHTHTHARTHARTNMLHFFSSSEPKAHKVSLYDGPIEIKFNLKYHWGGGKTIFLILTILISKGWGKGCIWF